uniref:serine protease 30-like isoform X1 n=1 Tax=Styela clava TaxID=7725 RepID=UPI00193A382A|nr:serine protease 30-like isoform X1 [Styela clava]
MYMEWLLTMLRLSTLTSMVEDKQEHITSFSSVLDNADQRRLSVSFHPTIIPKGFMQNYGSAKVMHSCRINIRKPCNKRIKKVSRSQCERWKCCWNPHNIVPCAKNKYYAVIETTPDVTTAETTKPVVPNPFAECGLVSPRPFDNSRSLEMETPIARFLIGMVTRRILRGTDTFEGDWPWMAYLYERVRGRDRGFICGGSLINEEYVVTAAHCIAQPNSPELYGIVLGQHNTSEISEHEVDFDIQRIVRHPEFLVSSFNNDIAILKLSEPVVFTRYIRPVCLVPSGFPTDSTTPIDFEGKPSSLSGTLCTVLGWGQTEKKNRSEIMQQLNVIIIPHFLCNSVTTIPSTEPYHGRPVNTNDPKFCAGGAQHEDTCAGDSGGPLLCIQNERYFLHGLTSYGTTPCGQHNKPGVYTRMADFYDWVMENMD